MEKKPDEKLGIFIKGGLQGQPGNPDDVSDEGVFIFKITPGGVASRKPDDLIVGQRIIEVNGQSLLGATHSEAVNAMRETGNSIHLIVCDGWNNSVKAIQNGRAEETTSSMMDEQPPRPDSAQEVHKCPENLKKKCQSQKTRQMKCINFNFCFYRFMML